MIGLEIVMLIVGFVCICASFFVARRQNDGAVEE